MSDELTLINQVDRDIEITLIGELIMKPEIYIDIAIDLMPNDFEVEQCRAVYNACIMLFAKGISIDPLTVISEIDGERDYYKQFLYSAASMVISTANYKEHIRIVSENARRRKAQGLCRELLDNLTLRADMEFCREGASSLLKTFDGFGREEIVSAESGYRNFIDNIGKIKEYIRSGIQKLDGYVKMSKGDFVGIGGRPSTGKTALSLQIMLYIARSYKVVYFSLETTAEKLFERMVSNYTEINYSAIRRGGLKQEDINTLKRICDGRLNELNFSIINASGWTVERIRAKALQMKADVVFIDYLGLIKSSVGKSQYEKTTDISINLHTMAQQDKKLVIALVQLSRDKSGQPDMASFRDSGQIEQDLDVAMILSTPNDDDSRRHLKKMTIVKNKDGLVGEIEFNFAGENQQFRAIENVYE